MESNKIVDHGNQILLLVGSSKSTSISMKYNETTNTSSFLQGLFLLYLHKTVITILCLQLSLTVSVHKDIRHHLYKGISTIVHLLSSLPESLRNGILQSSLLTSLQSKLLQSFLLVSLRNGILQSFLLASLQSGILQSSPLISLQSNFILASPLISLWKMFL